MIFGLIYPRPSSLVFLIRSSIIFWFLIPNYRVDRYPFALYNIHKAKFSWSVTSINVVNGIITIPQRKYFNLSRLMRIGIVLLNLIVSFSVSHIIYDSISSNLPPNPYAAGIRYSVYKSPTKIYNQNKKNMHENSIIQVKYEID